MYALLCLYLLEVRGERGLIVRTITTTAMLDRLGEIYHVPVKGDSCRIQVGCPRNGQRECTDRRRKKAAVTASAAMSSNADGILARCMFLGFYGKDRQETLLNSSYDLYRKVGPHHFDRIDVEFPEEERAQITGTSLR